MAKATRALHTPSRNTSHLNFIIDKEKTYGPSPAIGVQSKKNGPLSAAGWRSSAGPKGCSLGKTFVVKRLPWGVLHRRWASQVLRASRAIAQGEGLHDSNGRWCTPCNPCSEASEAGSGILDTLAAGAGVAHDSSDWQICRESGVPRRPVHEGAGVHRG